MGESDEPRLSLHGEEFAKFSQTNYGAILLYARPESENHLAGGDSANTVARPAKTKSIESTIPRM